MKSYHPPRPSGLEDDIGWKEGGGLSFPGPPSLGPQLVPPNPSTALGAPSGASWTPLAANRFRMLWIECSSRWVSLSAQFGPVFVVLGDPGANFECSVRPHITVLILCVFNAFLGRPVADSGVVRGCIYT